MLYFYVFRIDGPKKINFHLPPKCMGKFLKECIEKEDWDKIEFLFLGGGGQQCYPEGAGGLATGCDVSELSLSDLIKSKKKENNLQELLTVLIDHGAPVNGVSDLSPLSAAVDEKVLESALVLLKKKANANGLLQCKISKPGDTPFHTALRIGLSSGRLIYLIFFFMVVKNLDLQSLFKLIKHIWLVFAVLVNLCELWSDTY